MTRKKDAPAAEAAKEPEAKSEEAIEVVADAGQAQAEARRAKGYIGSAPGDEINNTVAAATEEG